MRFKAHENGMLRGFATVCFDGCFVVTGLRVLERDDGSCFVSMPSKKVNYSDGTWGFEDIAHPIRADTRRAIEGAVIAEYKHWKEQPKDVSAEVRA